jgi:hypothetical protein
MKRALDGQIRRANSFKALPNNTILSNDLSLLAYWASLSFWFLSQPIVGSCL